MLWAAVIVAAGHGTRFGRNKQLAEVAGRPVVAWSIEAFAGMPEISDIVVVTEPELLEAVHAVARPLVRSTTLTVVRGGADRQASACNGAHAVPAHCAGILIHDGARPLVRRVDVRAAMRVVKPGTASLLALRVVDTVKIADAEGKVVRTLDREGLWAAQTPQLATARDLLRAHDEAVRHQWPRATDDAGLLERAGLDVIVVPGSADNFKVTLPQDLVRAEHILASHEPAADEEEVLLIECFVPSRAVDDVVSELESRAARVDGVDRDLPTAVAIRAHASSAALRGFGIRLHALAGEDALFTTHLSPSGAS